MVSISYSVVDDFWYMLFIFTGTNGNSCWILFAPDITFAVNDRMKPWVFFEEASALLDMISLIGQIYRTLEDSLN